MLKVHSAAGSPYTSAKSNYQNAFRNFFVMLIGGIVFPFALGIQCLHENEKNRKVFWELYSADVVRGSSHSFLFLKNIYLFSLNRKISHQLLLPCFASMFILRSSIKKECREWWDSIMLRHKRVWTGAMLCAFMASLGLASDGKTGNKVLLVVTNWCWVIQTTD